MASSSRIPPPNDESDSEIVYISSDSESEGEGDADEYPFGWIRRNDPRFVGREIRVGKIPFGPGFYKPISLAQSAKGQCLVSWIPHFNE